MSRTWSIAATAGGEQVFSVSGWRDSVFALEYSDGTTFHPYATLSGLAVAAGTGGIKANDNGWGGGWINATGDGGLFPTIAFSKPDPRTDRLGLNFLNEYKLHTAH